MRRRQVVEDRTPFEGVAIDVIVRVDPAGQSQRVLDVSLYAPEEFPGGLETLSN